MKFPSFKLLLMLLLTVNLYSCRSNKDLVYLKNLPQAEVQRSIPFSSTEYKLRKNDNLYIHILSLNAEVNQLFNPSVDNGSSSGTVQQYGSLSAQYINGFQVNHNGNIELPILGNLLVINKTISESKKLIEQKVNEYFKEATVSVKLLSFKYTVIGEVAKPGVYYNYNNACTLLEAIGQAYGTTDYASLNNVIVLREDQKGTHSVKVDLSDKSLLTSEVYYLQPNDVIYVAPDKFKNTRINAPIYSLMLATFSTLIVFLKFMGS